MRHAAFLRGTGLGVDEAVAGDTVEDEGRCSLSLPLHKVSECTVRRTGFGHDMKDACDSWYISLPLNWHSNCDVAHEANCNEETKDNGGREKLHSVIVFWQALLS